MTSTGWAERPMPDEALLSIADYVSEATIDSSVAYETARLCLMDSLGCALMALGFSDCTRLLGPVVPGAILPGGARVPGTGWELDPVQAAFNTGAMIRWLDYNDTWLAAEWGHPSDNLGGILAAADWHARRRPDTRQPPLLVRDVLTAMIKAHEIQGVIALENAFNRFGLDHVLLVRIASAAVVTGLLGGTRDQIINTVSNAWVDGGCLRTYRHAPNTGSRKSWAAGDATSRGVQLALWALRGEMGYPSALTAPVWGFQDALLGGQPLRFPQGYGSYVMENILFKISFPAEFHAQTAVEAAVCLHPAVGSRLAEIERVRVETQQSAMRIINKTGPLDNPADRDHCLQYMIAVGMIHGALTAEHYLDGAASDPRIDALREKMEIVENSRYSSDYLDPEKRSIANAVQVFLADGSSTDRVEIEYPVGHRRRREEGIPLLKQKFEASLAARLTGPQCRAILDRFSDPGRLDATPVSEFMDLWAVG